MPPENIPGVIFAAVALLVLAALLMRSAERRRRAEHPLERDANAALLKLRALGCGDARIRERLEQVVALEAAGTSREFAFAMLRVGAAGAVTDADLAQLGLQHREIRVHPTAFGAHVEVRDLGGDRG